jgi:hypothetical protein
VYERRTPMAIYPSRITPSSSTILYAVYRLGGTAMQIRDALAILFVWPAVAGLALPEKPVPVRGQGCVTAGIESRCLVVRDLKTGKLYNLIFKGIQPALGDGIEFVALPHQGPTTCMQGATLDVTNWARKDTLKCKPGAVRKK